MNLELAMEGFLTMDPVRIHSFIHYTLSNPQIRCVAADNLWQPSSLPCLGISSTMYLKALQTFVFDSLTPLAHQECYFVSITNAWYPMHASQDGNMANTHIV